MDTSFKFNNIMNTSFKFNNVEERNVMEDRVVLEVIMKYLKETGDNDPYHNDYFDREIAFVLKKQEGLLDCYSTERKETIYLLPISIQKQILKFPIERKYTLKERIRILFKGE